MDMQTHLNTTKNIAYMYVKWDVLATASGPFMGISDGRLPILHWTM